MKVQGMYSELRSALQAPKNEEGWRALRAILAQAYPGPYDHHKAPNKKVLAQLEEEVMPAVEQGLDRGWPEWLRVVSFEDHPRIKRLGKVLHISFYGTTMKRFGERHKFNYKTMAITKKQIGELMPHWVEGASFEGFVLSHVDNQHLALVEALVAASGRPLRYLRWDNVSAPLQRTPAHRHKLEELEAMVEQVITAHGGTLESFGATFNHAPIRDQDMRAIYGPILRRGGELVALKALGMSNAPLHEADMFHELMASPALDGLEELSFPNDLTPARGQTLIRRAASVNLKRIGVGYLNYYNQGERLDPRALINADNLANVEAWDLRAERRIDEGWETPEAALWRAERAPEATREDEHAYALDREVVDLRKHDAAQTHAILFDGDKLRASARLKALRVAAVSDEDVAAIRDHGHEAWPSLECLVWMRSMQDEALYAGWNESPLLDQLTFLTWHAFYDPPQQRIFRIHHLTHEAQRALMLEALSEALDDGLHPFMAYRRWMAIKDQGLRRQPDRVAVARALGMTWKLPGEASALMAACEERFVALRGGKQRMLLNGPTYAYSQGDVLLWPDPIYSQRVER